MVDRQVETEAQAGGPGKSGRRRNLMVVGFLAAVMVVEGLAVFVLVKHFGADPQTAQATGAAGLDPLAGEKAPEEVEVEVGRFRAQSAKSEPPVMWEFAIYASVAESDKEAFSELVERKKATIQDRLTSVVRAADPALFSQPDFALLRQQFKQELCKIAGDEGMIREVLIPTSVPYSGY